MQLLTRQSLDESSSAYLSYDRVISAIEGHRSLKTWSYIMKSVDSDLVILDFGSNDLANIKNCHANTIKNIAKFLFSWVMNICAHRVLVIGILPRKRGLRGNTHDFDTIRAVYNSTMKRLCGSSARADLKKIRGFENIPVDDWSLDGIHPRNMSHYV